MDTNSPGAADAAIIDEGRKRTHRRQRQDFFSVCSLRCYLPTSIRLAKTHWGRVGSRHVAQTFQSAVSQVCNLRASRIFPRVAFADPLPIGNRRYGRLESLRYFGGGSAARCSLAANSLPKKTKICMIVVRIAAKAAAAETPRRGPVWYDARRPAMVVVRQPHRCPFVVELN